MARPRSHMLGEVVSGETDNKVPYLSLSPAVYHCRCITSPLKNRRLPKSAQKKVELNRYISGPGALSQKPTGKHHGQRTWAGGEHTCALYYVYNSSSWQVSWYVCTVATFPFVGLRMYSRWKRVGKLCIDDYLILLSVACLIGDLAIQQHMWNLGLGDMSTVTPRNLEGIMKMIVPGSTLYVTSLWAIKFALVFFYKSLAAPGSRMLVLYNAALALLAVTYLIIFFDIIFQCFPHDKRWSTKPNCKHESLRMRNVLTIFADQCSPRASEINYWLTIFCTLAH
jgi:hypothetical protein